MERKKSRSDFLKQNTSFLETCVSGCLPWIPFWNLASGGSKISNKNTFSGLGLGILPPAGQRSQQKHVPGKQTRIYSIYSPYAAIFGHIGPISAHIGPISAPIGPYRL